MGVEAHKGLPQGKVLAPSKLAHVVLRTKNFSSMVSFYKIFLGAHATYENKQLAFLTYDDEHHRVAIVDVPNTTLRDRNSAGMDHVASTFNSLRDLTLAYKQRAAYGILPLCSINHGPTMSLYYQDPDGNKIETQVDLFDTLEEIAFYTTPEFNENPIGVDVDPEDIIKRLDNGEEEKSIKKRPRIGPRGPDSIVMPSEPTWIGPD
ncbi:putative VOC domain-containing protein [Seiridium cardinale]|uniref:VOC domain-containing protein n=1 Tax=Seiridium cardinale TaxID=138064 RepID=A0ABR2X7M7_9PEZI